MERDARRPGHPAEEQQRQVQRGDGQPEDAQHAGQGGTDAEPDAHHGQRPPRPEPVDEPPAGQHADRVDEQEGEIHAAHLLLGQAVADEPLAAGDGDCDPVEVGQEDEPDEHGHDQPADAGGAGVGHG
jgi:hypothetical protein